MNRFTFASIHLVLAAVAACQGRLAVTQAQDEGSGGTSDGGDSGERPGASGGTAARTGAGGRSVAEGGASGGEAGGASKGGFAGADGGDPAAGGAGGDPSTGGFAGSTGGEPATGGAAGGPSTNHCDNQLKDAGESDIDCGGAECSACGIDAVCLRTSDCESHVCRASRCRAPACDDNVQNGDETGVDCGGACLGAVGGHGGFCKVMPTECACATSAGLSPIACGVVVEAWDNTAHIDATGDAAALALCVDSACDAHRWSADDGLVSLEQNATVRGISQDGRAVLVTHRQRGEPFLWQTGDVRTAVPDMEMLDLSADGTTVLASLAAHARWTAARGLEYVSASSRLGGWPVMTPDGVFVAGQYQPAVGDASLVRWNAAGEETILSAIPERGYSFTEAISDDGQIVAGSWTSIASGAHVFRWSTATGFVTLGASPPADSTNSTSYPPRLNADGSVMLGNYKPSSSVSSMAFRWTQASGVTALAGSPPEGSVVQAASADASVAIGYTLESSAQPAFVWDNANGVRPLRSVLEDAQVDLEGWELGKPLVLSADGKVVLGQGTCGGEPAVFRAVLP